MKLERLCFGTLLGLSALLPSACDPEGPCHGGPCVEECPFELGDCDLDPSNGCETPLLFDSGNCGACNNVCASGSICEDGACLELCAPSTADCDGDTNNLCETDVGSDPENCGACGVSCGGAACTQGACGS